MGNTILCREQRFQKGGLDPEILASKWNIPLFRCTRKCTDISELINSVYSVVANFRKCQKNTRVQGSNSNSTFSSNANPNHGFTTRSNSYSNSTSTCPPPSLQGYPGSKKKGHRKVTIFFYKKIDSWKRSLEPGSGIPGQLWYTVVLPRMSVGVDPWQDTTTMYNVSS